MKNCLKIKNNKLVVKSKQVIFEKDLDVVNTFKIKVL